MLEKWTDLKGLLEELPKNFNKRYVYYLIQTKQIPHIKPSPNKLLFNINDIDQWLRNCRVEPEQEEVADEQGW